MTPSAYYMQALRILTYPSTSSMTETISQTFPIVFAQIWAFLASRKKPVLLVGYDGLSSNDSRLLESVIRTDESGRSRRCDYGTRGAIQYAVIYSIIPCLFNANSKLLKRKWFVLNSSSSNLLRFVITHYKNNRNKTKHEEKVYHVFVVVTCHNVMRENTTPPLPRGMQRYVFYTFIPAS